jgi:hypothetical protein
MSGEERSRNGKVIEESPRALAAWGRDEPETWLAIELAANGYVLRDAASRETWVIGDADRLEAAAGLLIELNERLRTVGRSADERRVVVTIEAGDDWLRAHPHHCQHIAIRKLETEDSERWVCVCGLEFVPARERPRTGDLYGESADAPGS